MREIGHRMNRCLSGVGALKPGEYCVVEHESMAGTLVRVYVRCPDCGGVDELRHDVARTGLVTPRWSCPTETCGFRQRLTLDAWEP